LNCVPSTPLNNEVFLSEFKWQVWLKCRITISVAEKVNKVYNKFDRKLQKVEFSPKMASKLPFLALRGFKTSQKLYLPSVKILNITLNRFTPSVNNDIQSKLSSPKWNFFSTSSQLHEKETAETPNAEPDAEVEEATAEQLEEELENDNDSGEPDWMTNLAQDPKDRSRVIPLEMSMAYLDSTAYTGTYGDKKVFVDLTTMATKNIEILHFINRFGNYIAGIFQKVESG
jgi:hypothetical protein